MSNLTPKQLKELSERNRKRLAEVRAAEEKRKREELEWARQQAAEAARIKRGQQLIFTRLIKRACHAAFEGKYFAFTKELDYELVSRLEASGFRYSSTASVINHQQNVIRSIELEINKKYQPRLLNKLNALWLRIAAHAEIHWKASASFIERELMAPIEKHFSSLIMEKEYLKLIKEISIFSTTDDKDAELESLILELTPLSSTQRAFLEWSTADSQTAIFEDQVIAVAIELKHLFDDKESRTQKLDEKLDLIYDDYIKDREDSSEEIATDRDFTIMWDSADIDSTSDEDGDSLATATGSKNIVNAMLLDWLNSDAGRLFATRFNAFCEAAAADGKSVALVPLSGQIDDQSFPTTAHVVVLAEALGFKAKLLSESLRVSWE